MDRGVQKVGGSIRDVTPASRLWSRRTALIRICNRSVTYTCLYNFSKYSQIQQLKFGQSSYAPKVHLKHLASSLSWGKKQNVINNMIGLFPWHLRKIRTLLGACNVMNLRGITAFKCKNINQASVSVRRLVLILSIHCKASVLLLMTCILEDVGMGSFGQCHGLISHWLALQHVQSVFK